MGRPAQFDLRAGCDLHRGAGVWAPPFAPRVPGRFRRARRRVIATFSGRMGYFNRTDCGIGGTARITPPLPIQVDPRLPLPKAVEWLQLLPGNQYSTEHARRCSTSRTGTDARMPLALIS